ncbi:uncharacterized protein G2W53_015858 [Senna tora]|uniref:Uncharacterized protein n=1 Tax=Senna tora TaxID=362788 RepID=A0A834WVK0_9FABA|nr:uncharacterized protein G2W53_015858 [Senna tora]
MACLARGLEVEGGFGLRNPIANI